MSVEVTETASTEKLQEPIANTVEPSLPDPDRIEPDLAFIRTLMKAGGDSLKQCMQCGTCSATCALSSDHEPFPRKEMAWASWGMKDALVNDPDVWLCHQCNDCSIRCPRGARPGDVLAAVRQEWIVHHAVPRFLARWAHQPQAILLLLGIMTVLLGAVLYLKDPVARVLGISEELSPEIVFSYSSMLPRWMLNLFFLILGVLVLLPVLRGVAHLWKSMKTVASREESGAPKKGLLPSIASAFKSILWHEKFRLCTEAKPRSWSHMAVFFGFLALMVVTLWVITAPYNPLIKGPFIYPLNFWNPFKLLANAGGIALIAGCMLMIKDRIKNSEQTGVNNYSDWSLISLLLAVALTGFMTEALHFVRLDPHRHLAYFVHLVFVGVLLLYMPYTKFAHIVYRTAAVICSERYNRTKQKQQEQIPTRMESTAEGTLKGDTAFKPAETGQARLVVIVVVLILIPLAFSVFPQILPNRTDSSESFLEKPDPKYTDCIREASYMRFHHWELLRGIREEVVRYGIRSDEGLSKCPECHTSRERFCDQCHNAASVAPDCFSCHYYP